MIKEFFKRLFCRHEYEQIALWEVADRIEIRYMCRKCGKDYWDIIYY